VNSTVIQYPETRIQDQSVSATVSIAADKFDFKILCNYGLTLIDNPILGHFDKTVIDANYNDQPKF